MSYLFPFIVPDVIAPVLTGLDLWDPAAEKLVLGTALVESGLRRSRQMGGGPARGIFQMEPATFKDIERYLLKPGKLDLRARAAKNCIGDPFDFGELAGNDFLAAAFCRLKYLPDPHPLPDPDDIEGLAAYWKRTYNSPLGA
ncbi:MAG: hypothetical protein V7727_18270 [Sneathiella sp.]